MFKDSLFSGNTFSEKQRMFTTQAIYLRAVHLKFLNTNFSQNFLEKGYMFEFKSNFRNIIFLSCVIANNTGNLIETAPAD